LVRQSSFAVRRIALIAGATRAAVDRAGILGGGGRETRIVAADIRRSGRRSSAVGVRATHDETGDDHRK
jgi:hypothetical protein